MKNVKRVIYCFIILSIFNPLKIFALSKTETVYSNLNYDGSVLKTTINIRLSNIERGMLLITLILIILRI